MYCVVELWRDAILHLEVQQTFVLVVALNETSLSESAERHCDLDTSWSQVCTVAMSGKATGGVVLNLPD